jgi:hypothetical protein
MPAKLEEIEATYLRQRHRFDDCIIGEAFFSERGEFATLITIKGDADDGELENNGHYRFYGRFSKYRNKRTGAEERQFHFDTFVQAACHGREGIVQYLCKVGGGNGLGTSTACKLWDAYGSDAVRKIREAPETLREFSSRITGEQCRTIGEILEAQKATEDATIELTGLLSGRGLPKTTARKAIKRWGNRAAQMIRRDPYSLMAFRGCGFKLCDSLWIEFGLSPHRLRRQALCAWHSIASQSTGDTWYSVKTVEQAIQQSIGGTNADPVRAIKLATRLGRMSPNHYGALAAIRSDGATGPVVETGGRLWLAEGKNARAEQDVASFVVDAVHEAKPQAFTEYSPFIATWEDAAKAVQCYRCSRELTAPEVHIWNGRPFGPTCIGYISDGTDVDVVSLQDWIAMQPPVIQSAILQLPKRQEIGPFSLWPDPTTIKGIDDHQRGELARALVSRICILGGSPGTGKTYTTAQLIKSLLKTGLVSPEDIAIGCPTGKAAVRITEVMQAAGVPLIARTWHSLLGVGKTDSDDGGWSFQHNEKNPWQFRVIIGDESSMMDASLMRAVLAARPRGCHFLLVGDVHQLPPVGTGAPLRDMIASGIVGYGELTEIKRNSGGIVEACAAIRDGKPWSAGDNLRVIERNDSEQQIAAMGSILDKCHENGFDPVWDCQVLVAVNAKSPLSRKRVNEFLQDRLNPSPAVKGSPFRLRDKIVCLKNGRYTAIDADDSAKDAEGGGNEVYVANGELGEVIEIEDKSIVAKLNSPYRIVRIPRGKPSNGEVEGDDATSTGCSWDLAYGLTCHKLQGSEAPVVIILLDEYPGARRVCSREWIYTAISRARQKCFLVGKKATADAMCRQVALGKRKTFLRELLQLKFNDLAMEDL